MNILMLTNVFTPQVGGVTRSVQQYSEAFRQQGHRVLIVAPEYDRTPAGETDVIRVAAIPNFYLNQYPLPLPVRSVLEADVAAFKPDIVHAHHPFLLGSTAQSIAADLNVPLIYTHHTRYSIYIETKTSWPRAIEQAVIELIIGFANLSDAVVAPSRGIAALLRQRGVTSRIEIIPTGVDLNQFDDGNGNRFRDTHQVDRDAFLIGHVGRLAKEKNCGFLAQAVGQFLKDHPDALFLAVGDGPERGTFESALQQMGVREQATFTGFLSGQELIDAYFAMDLFAFASHSETQGMVLAEAMAAGTPVVAVSGTGVRDMLVNGRNGWLIERDDVAAFVEALDKIRSMSAPQRDRFRRGSRETAESVSQTRCAQKMLALYEESITRHRQPRGTEWHRLQQKWDAAWNRWKNRARAVARAAQGTITAAEQMDDV